MDEEDDPSAATADPDARASEREDEIEDLREDLEAFRLEVEDRTVRRAEIESDLKEYVRSRLRRGHVRGWGPYLVLLYGTAMTVGAFYFLAGIWAILAMFVIWLSTLGLYVMMVLTGAMIHALSLPGAAVDTVRDWRS
jgi:Flp pilus assembly protein TadB